MLHVAEAYTWLLKTVEAGGIVMIPIIGCSVLAATLAIERLWTLRRKRVIPPKLVEQVWQVHKEGKITKEFLHTLRNGSPLGRVLAAGLVNRYHARDVVKEVIIETGRQVVAELEHYLNTLGTIAAVSPLLGLLGTVTGMIQAFTVITTAGVGNPMLLSGGIAEALITTAAGLIVAIPTLILHRYLSGRVDRLALDMEEQALKMVEVMQGEREGDKT